ncbi:DUF4176 domain-containing protein [Bacillus sp. ISL-35]|uniref:DUF4176 domain-containing protein n=1 Tax=Bacillus sp. ISL-35 TaxID=2819122 RepID=UPI001BECAE81|nr:DUF4176 domain-containing protein [Bacillus sp. ISL-35]MBT2680633.1 DUF4176 domain-containing protein [Bacillus sp. ISL-35]MBT2702736.1 DUF4176 domain-containing protein [Chryseobacterium sp. ISL-80]
MEYSKKRLLPTGSVVILKEGSKRLLIYGRKQILMNENEPKMYDYLACYYPEGYINPDHTFVFNHEDIESTVFIGYVDKEEDAFAEYLATV